MRRIAGLVLGTLVLAGVIGGREATADEFKFAVGPSFMSGFLDVKDFYFDATDADDQWTVPVGVAFLPYYEFSHGSRVGVDIGPIGAIIIQEIGMGDDTWYYWDVPVALTYGFTFLPQANASPYARVGVKHHFAGGDFVQSSTPGLFGAVGVDLLRKKMIGIGIEVGYDASVVELGPEDAPSGFGEEVHSGGVLVSIRAVF